MKGTETELKQPTNPILLIACCSIRSKTVAGEYCKQRFSVIKAKNNHSDIALIIEKLVLSDRFSIYEKTGFENLKQFKNQRLYKQEFAIKLKTLNDALETLNFKMMINSSESTNENNPITQQ